MTEGEQIVNLSNDLRAIERLVVYCRKCSRKKDFVLSANFYRAQMLYKKGWRYGDGGTLCPKCVKMEGDK